MPIYEYVCGDCGPFTGMAPMAAFAAPQPCPACGELAPRNLVTAPALGGPVGASQAATAGRPSHAAGCGCCGPRRSLRAEAVPARK